MKIKTIKPSKTILIWLAILAIAVSVAANIYYFGWLNLRAYLMSKGFDIAIDRIIQGVTQKGEIRINDNLILVPKQ